MTATAPGCCGGSPHATNPGHETATSDNAPARPPVVDRAAWQAEIDALRIREKAHTRASDVIAAARRRLPMVAMDRRSDDLTVGS